MTTCARELDCDVKVKLWFYFSYENRSMETCYMYSQTIDDPHDVISTGKGYHSIEGYNVKDNKDAKYIPENIGTIFPNLIIARFWNCSLKSVDNNSWKNLKKLVALYLGHNQIMSVECGAFKDLISLEVLTLAHNQIVFLCSTIFDSLVELTQLFLDDNELEFLNRNIFRSLVKLKQLELDDNHFFFLHEKIFHRLISLTTISLSGNQFERISSNLFSNNTKLAYIWIGNNPLKSVKFDLFDGLKNLKKVNLNNTCVDKEFLSDSIASMKNDLKAKCSTASSFATPSMITTLVIIVFIQMRMF